MHFLLNEILGNMCTDMTYVLPELKYAFNALEKSIDAKTMEIHYTKHHQAYVDNLNKALDLYPELQEKDLEDLLMNINTLPEDIKMAVRNNGGGHWNHSFFWDILSPNAEDCKLREGSKIHDMIQKYFGSYDEFVAQFKNAALSRFGSGWVWLVELPDGSLKIFSTPNQDNPLMPVSEIQGKPLLALDVWEHVYYLRYQNRRADYVDAYWNVVNWSKVEEFLGKED